MRYVFDTYVLDTQRYEFQHAGEPLKLRRKVFQVLAYLLEHRDRVVPKQELLEHLWPDQFVGDEVLKACITALRKALGEKGRAPRFVRTLHGQGYRFVAAVEVREHLPTDDAPPARPLRGSAGAIHQAEVSSFIGRLPSSPLQRDELVAQVDEGILVASASQLKFEDPPVEGERLIDVAHLEGHMVEADRSRLSVAHLWSSFGRSPRERS